MLKRHHVFWICLTTFSGLLLFFFGGANENSVSEQNLGRKSEPVFETLKRIRDVTPDNIVQPPKIETKLVERLPAVVPPPPPPRPPEPDTWSRPIVIEAGIIKSGKLIIELADITPVRVDEYCEAGPDDRWPCGMLARTEMRMFVRGRPIECDPVEETTSKHVTTRCRLASYDMSAWLVKNGWAKPQGKRFEDEFKDARENQRGIWRATKP